MSAIIKIDQARPGGNPSVGTAGFARNDLWKNLLVGLTSSGGGSGPAWTMLSKPSGSSATIAGPGSALASFTPDLPGSYRIQLTVDNSLLTNKQIRVARCRFDSTGNIINQGIVLPAPGELDSESNYAGNDRGWDEPIEGWFNYTLSLTASAGTSGITSLATLTSSQGTPNQSVVLLGYYVPGDGGGGKFYWDATSTETPNSGTIFQVPTIATGRWKRTVAKPLNVRWFGAKGDWKDVSSVAISSGSNTFTHSGFTTADISKRLTIVDAGILDVAGFRTHLTATITNVVGNTITLNNAAYNTVATSSCAYFTDDQTAFNAASQVLSSSGGGGLYVPGVLTYYGITRAVLLFTGTHIYGDGITSAIRQIEGGWDIDLAHDGQNFGMLNIYAANNVIVSKLGLFGSVDATQQLIGDPFPFIQSPGAVYFASAGDCVVENCDILNFRGAAIFGSRTSPDTQARLMQRANVRNCRFNNCCYWTPKTTIAVLGNTIEMAGHHHTIEENYFFRCGSPINMAGDHCDIVNNVADDYIGQAWSCGDSFQVTGNSVRGNKATMTLTSSVRANIIVVPSFGGGNIVPPLGGVEPAEMIDNYFKIEIKDTFMLQDRALLGITWEVADVKLENNTVVFQISTNISNPFKLAGFFSQGNAGQQNTRLINNKVIFYSDNGSILSGSTIGGYQVSGAPGGRTVWSTHNICSGATGVGNFAFNYTAFSGSQDMVLHVEGDSYDAGSAVFGGTITAPNVPIYAGYNSLLANGGLDAPFALGIPIQSLNTVSDALLFRSGSTGKLVRGAITDNHVDGNANIQGGKIYPAHFNGSITTTGDADVVQLKISPHVGSQTSNLVEFEDQSGNPVFTVDPDGQTYLNRENAPVFIGKYPPAPTAYAGIWMGLTPGTETSSNWAFLSNGGQLLINAPQSNNVISFYCGFGGSGELVRISKAAGLLAVQGFTSSLGAFVSGNINVNSVAGSNALYVNSPAAPAYSQLLLQANSLGGIIVTAYGADNAFMGYDVDYVNGLFISRHTSYSMFYKAGDKMSFVGNAGVTVGISVTAISRGNIDLRNGNWRLGDINTANARLDVTGSAVITGSLIVTEGLTGSQGAFITGSVLQTANGRRFHVTSITGSYRILSSDEIIGVGLPVGGAPTIFTPPTPILGDGYIIVDTVGNSAIQNITLSGSSGKNINGSSTQVMTLNYQSVTIFYNGSSWSII